MSENLRHRDRFDVEVDGEQLNVYNWVNIKQPAIVRGGNPVVETFEAEIGAGDATFSPEAVSTWVAEELKREFRIDPADHGIDVIDPEADEVTVL